MLDRYFYTFHNPAGNRLARGAGSFPDVITIDIPLRGAPAWAVAYAMETAVWHIVLADGGLQVVEVDPDGAARTLAYEPGWFEGAQPPLVGVSMVEGTYVMRSDASVSPLTHPVPVNDFEVLYVDRAGDLVLGREEGVVARLPVNAAPAARLVMNRAGQVALYANASAPGDHVAGSSLIALEVRDSQLRLLARIDLPGEQVYQGVAPFWADVDGDGVEDLVATVADATLGARLRAYLWDGARIRQEVDSPASGPGTGWLHQLAAAPFGPAGASEIAALRASQSGGALEFFRFSDNALRLTASLADVMTRAPGSRNDDQCAAGDFSGAGQPEILVMDPARRQVIAVQRRDDKAEIAWHLDAGAEIISNFAPVELLEGGLGLAVGRADARLRVWLPRG